MNNRNEHIAVWRNQVHAALVVAKKDMMIYYFKAPVLIFGVILPVFFFLAFAVGRSVPVESIVPGMLAMALFFTASAVGPLVTPWERQAKTYERLVTSPASIESILVGDILAGMTFGIVLSLVPLTLSLLATEACISSACELALGVSLGALSFASLGVLLAAPSTESPSQVMMLSNLVRLPLIFISGIFIPVSQMPVWARWLAPFSPLSYCVDLIQIGFGKSGHFPIWLDLVALPIFVTGFFLLSRRLHLRSRRKPL